MKTTTAALKALPQQQAAKLVAPLALASDYATYTSSTVLRGRDISTIDALSVDEIELILDCATALKQNPKDPAQKQIASGKTLAMLFEKPSLRTRITFEVGMIQLGGTALFIEGKLGVREAVCDVARNLDRWVDGIMARTFEHSTVTDLCQYAAIPVINGLSNLEHPCQALADLLTILEHKGGFKGLNIAYVGDANNVANSLMLAALKLGANFTIACPASFAPKEDIVYAAAAAASQSGGKLRIMHDPVEAVNYADVVYTDTWVSMGQEHETESRKQAFSAFQVNSTMVSYAKHDAIIMHCLPAHRGAEITDEELDGPHSVVLDQAENRLHAQKAILTLIL